MPSLTDSMSSAVSGRVLAVAGAAVAVGVGVALTRGLGAERPPSEWRKVGTLAELNLYPLKSGQPIPSQTLLASEAGLRDGAIRDRVFVAVDRNGKFVSARTHPRLLHVEVKAVPKQGGKDEVVFEFRSAMVPECLTVDPAPLVKEWPTRKRITIHGSPVSGVDCGDEAAAWIRAAVVDPAAHRPASAVADLRLMYYPMEVTDRGPKAPAGTRGIFSDMTSYHLLTTSSLAALNSRLSSPVSARHFRPNFLVDGPAAFEEDGWTWIRIGDKVLFKVVMPCGRCVLTTVDPETGIRSTEVEPLKTLRQFRKPNEEQKKKMGGDSPMLGLRLAIESIGEVSVGDAVFVAP